MLRYFANSWLLGSRPVRKVVSLLLLSVVAFCAIRYLSGAESGEHKTLVGRMAGERDESSVSLVRLLANPERYHNRRIRVHGYLIVAFEGTGIYLSKEDADHVVLVNGFRVSFDRSKIPFDGPHGPVRYANQYVSLEGTFDAENPRHWQGSIVKVDRITVLKDYGEQRARDAREALKAAGVSAASPGEQESEETHE